MMSNRDEMIAEAIDLELEFPGNISNKKLAAILAEAKGEPEPLDETPPPSPAVKSVPSDEDITESARDIARRKVQDKAKKQREMIARRKESAFKTRIVTLTNKDNRENDVVTTAYLSMQNQFFAIARNVPLDVPVELEQCLINLAESCMITMHKDEIIKGHRTGNKVTVRVKKYAVSYTGQEPS
jgi:hypothetical protein